MKVWFAITFVLFSPKTGGTVSVMDLSNYLLVQRETNCWFYIPILASGFLWEDYSFEHKLEQSFLDPDK